VRSILEQADFIREETPSSGKETIIGWNAAIIIDEIGKKLRLCAQARPIEALSFFEQALVSRAFLR